MKVKIGNYPSWFGPYQLAQKLMFWVPKEKDEHGFPYTADRVHKFGEWLAHGSIEPDPEVGEITKMWEDRPTTWLYKFLSWIHSKKERTIKVHIDRWDTWSMDHTLAYIVLPMLKQLKATKHGAPYVDPKECPPELKPKKQTKKQKDNCETDSTHYERWNWVLDEMIFAFENKVNDDWEDQFESGEWHIQWKKLEDGMSQMVYGPNHTREHDWEGRKAYQERISNGFRLFGKYYESLWD